MKIYEMPQGTDEWKQIRVGRITGSEFHKIMQNGKGGGWSVAAIKYAHKLAGERHTGVSDELVLGNKYTDYGHYTEGIAREILEAELLEPIKEVGFIDYKIGEIGCSPDGLASKTMHEIKCFTVEHHMTIAHNGFDDKQKYQTIFNTYISGKEKGILFYYNPYFKDGLDKLIFEFSKDDFTDEMEARLFKFNTFVRQIRKETELKYKK